MVTPNDAGEVVAGDAILWSANILPGASIEDAPVQAIAVHYGPEPV